MAIESEGWRREREWRWDFWTWLREMEVVAFVHLGEGDRTKEQWDAAPFGVWEERDRGDESCDLERRQIEQRKEATVCGSQLGFGGERGKRVGRGRR